MRFDFTDKMYAARKIEPGNRLFSGIALLVIGTKASFLPKGRKVEQNETNNTHARHGKMKWTDSWHSLSCITMREALYYEEVAVLSSQAKARIK